MSLDLKMVAAVHKPGLSGDVDDYTNYRYFFRELVKFSLQVFDQLVAVTINFIVLSVFTILYVFTAPFSAFLVAFFEWFKNLVTTKVSSFVTLSTPNIHDDLPKRLLSFKPQDNEFSLENAAFLLGLSTLVYENNDTIETVLSSLEQTKGNLRHRSVPKESCVFHLFWSLEKNFMVLTFKGTSPLNWVEWLTDAELGKVVAEPRVLSGGVHEGFYNAFEFPAHIHRHKEGREENGPLTNGIPSDNQPQYEKINARVLEAIREFEAAGQSPKVWITGHSLGAALASIYFSYVVSGDEKTFPSLRSLRKYLVGAYTYGTPRTGDAQYQEEVTWQMEDQEKVFYRVVNANDVVTQAPWGGNTLLRRWINSWAPEHYRKRVFTLTDYYHIGQPYSFPYHGDYLENKEFPVRDHVYNIFAYFVDNSLAWGRLLVGQETLFSAVSRQVTPFPLFDHFPSEYYNHIKKHIKKSK